MKIFRFLFSRLFLTALSLIVQAGCFVALFYFASVYANIVYLLFKIAGVALVFFLNNQPMKAEYKIPWIFLTLILPVFGLVLYLFYSNPRMSKRQTRRMEEIRNACMKYLPQTAMNDCDKADELQQYYTLDEYLARVSDHRGSIGNKVDFYPCGEKYWEAMLADIEKAERYIYLQFFIIKPGVMWTKIHDVLQRKAAEGLDVRVMYDDMGSSTTPLKFAKKLRAEGIKCVRFNPLTVWASGKLNNRDHRKILVVDGKVGFTGGINIGDEYVNIEHPFGTYWKDTGIRIEGEAVKVLLYNFLMSFDSGKNQPLSDYEYIFDIPTIKFDQSGYVQPFVDGPKPFYSEQIGENNYLNLIGLAKKSLWITTPYLICDNALLTAIRNAASRGVDVRLITPHVPDKKLVFAVTRNNYRILAEGGVKIYEFEPGFLHAKQMIVDGEVAFIGTINLDYRSLTHHFECGANLYKCPAVQQIAADFVETQEKSVRMHCDEMYVNIFAKFAITIVNIFLPML